MLEEPSKLHIGLFSHDLMPTTLICCTEKRKQQRHRYQNYTYEFNVRAICFTAGKVQDK